MHQYKYIHQVFLGLVPAAILAGYGRDFQSDLNVFLLSFLIFVMRIKFFIDDETYFKDVHEGKLPGGTPFYVGISLALISWVLWIFAGFFVTNIEYSSLIMMFSLIPSTAWIVAAIVKRGAYSEQVPWMMFNIFYCFCFFLIWSRSAAWNPFNDNKDLFSTIILIILIIVFFLDFIVSRILESGRLEARKTREAVEKSPKPKRNYKKSIKESE